MSLLVLVIVGIALFILWHFLPQTEKRAPQPSPKYRIDPRVSVDEREWRTFVEEHCESPAEIAFLRAMIEAHGMTPQGGSLVANDVRLDFQVEEGRYRVDFLVNKWLVVEIDGAAYHSSPEAKSRDQLRDRYFEGLGYTVLRLPAKLVLQTPKEAVKAVASVLALGKREVELPPARTNGFSRLAHTAAAFSQSVELAEKKHAVRQALASAELAVAGERSTLEAAMNLATQRSEHALWLAGLTADGLALYEQSVADIESAVADECPELSGQSAHPYATTQLPFVAPTKTGDGWIDERVADGFRLLAEDRQANFQSVRTKLAADASIRPHMQLALTELGRDDLWASVN